MEPPYLWVFFVAFFHVLCLFLVLLNCIWDLSSPERNWKWSCLVMSNSLQPHGLYLPGSSIHGIFQARLLEWVAIPSPGDLPNPGIEPGSPALQADSLPSEPQGGFKDQTLTPLHWKHEVLTTELPGKFMGFFRGEAWGGWPHRVACRLSVPQPGIKSMPLAVEGWSPNYYTAREFPSLPYWISTRFL